MSVLSFKVTGNKLVRKDMNRLLKYERNTARVKFEFDTDWARVSPVACQFQRSEEICVDVFVENDECIVPWEVLEEPGVLSVRLAGGDLMLTNSVEIVIIDSGLIGGLAETAASPTVYAELYSKLKAMEKEVSTEAVKAEKAELAQAAVTALTAETADVGELKADSIDLSSTTEFDADAKKYASIKHKLKTGSGGFELSAVTTDKNGNELKNSIKTSNSKLTVDVNDYELKSAKNIELGCEGKLNVNSGNGIEILNEDHKVLTGNNSGYTTTIYGGDGATKMELDKENIEVDCERDLTVQTKNERHFVGDSDGTFEVINSCNTGITRLIQHNDNENKYTKLYLGSDNAVIGVLSGTEYSTGNKEISSSKITSGITITAGGVKITGNKLNVDGLDFLAIMPLFIELYKDDADKLKLVWNVAGGLYAEVPIGSNLDGSNVTGYVLKNGYVFCVGTGDTGDLEAGMTEFAYINKAYVLEGITSIGSSLFEDCTNLTGVFLPSTLTEIGGYCFYGCTSLLNIEIPENVTLIPIFAFYGCTSLGSVTIPEGVTEIDANAFFKCECLTDVTLPESLKSIGIDAFGETGITDVSIPKNTTEVGQAAFANCENLERVEINGCIDSFVSTFAGCTSLTTVTFMKGSYVKNIAPFAFNGCSKLSEINLQSGLQYIRNKAFYECISLSSIYIPSSITSIDSTAFSKCTGLKTITIDKSKGSISGAPWGATNATVVWTA